MLTLGSKVGHAARSRRLALLVSAGMTLMSVLVAAGLAETTRADDRSAALPDHPWGHEELDQPTHTRTWVISYRAHTGRTRHAYVLLPRWYGPASRTAVPLVLSPHGRGLTGLQNTKLWGDLPAIGRFGVVSPDGEGDHLGAYSWGAPGQIEDLARMPAVVARALPWLRIDRARVYAVGGSMGGQESLLLLAKHPRLLAGVAAFDSLIDFAHQYREFPTLRCNSRCRRQLGAPLGRVLQQRARTEVGGDPAHFAAAYAARSPITYARAIAFSCVPLQLWWSRKDQVVVDSRRQTGRLLAMLERRNPAAPVEGIEGYWRHSLEMPASKRLPFALVHMGLLPAAFDGTWGLSATHYTPAPEPSCARPAPARLRAR
jgi:poly(3-hydroxybutyrate) depolymerase